MGKKNQSSEALNLDNQPKKFTGPLFHNFQDVQKTVLTPNQPWYIFFLFGTNLWRSSREGEGKVQNQLRATATNPAKPAPAPSSKTRRCRKPRAFKTCTRSNSGERKGLKKIQRSSGWGFNGSTMYTICEVHKNPRFFYQRQVARFIEEITCYTEGLQTGFTNLPAIHSDAHGLPVTGCNISHLWKTPVFRTYQRCKNGAPKTCGKSRNSLNSLKSAPFFCLTKWCYANASIICRWFTCNVWALDDMTAAWERCQASCYWK